MAFGGLAPLPLRLGGTAEDGWRPEEHACLAADISAQLQIQPLIVVTASIAADKTVTVLSCLSRAGTDPDVVTIVGSPTLFAAYLTLESFAPPGSKASRKWRLRHGVAQVSGEAEQEMTTALNPAILRFAAETLPATVHLELFGDVEPSDLHDYGADEDKAGSRTEGEMPYAYSILQDIIADNGTAYTDTAGSIVMMENIAEARLWACIRRMAERHSCNQVPATAGQAIFRLAKQFGVTRGNDTEWQLRKHCVNRARFRATGGDRDKIRSAVSEVLGDAFVGLENHFGTLSAPPSPTYWFGGDTGPASHDLGPGTWTSDRARLTISLQHVTGSSDAAVLNIADRELKRLLDGTLPDWCTWDRAFDASSGFTLGTSILGESSL